jgi:hypothetical protein
MLREKFPNAVARGSESPAVRGAVSTGLARLDAELEGGFPNHAITEVIASRCGCGSALFLNQLLRQAAKQNHFAALIDGRDSFDVSAIPQKVLSRLLWIRCANADEAIKAADLVLRDGNLRLVLLDLSFNPESELRKISAPTWYRFQRILEDSNAVLMVLTPRAMISPAELRITLRARFDLDAMLRKQSDLVSELEFEIPDARRCNTELLRRTA